MTRKRFTPCYVVLRKCKLLEPVDPHSVGYEAHTLGVFESLLDADVFCEKCNTIYNNTLNQRLYAEIQTSTFQADV